MTPTGKKSGVFQVMLSIAMMLFMTVGFFRYPGQTQHLMMYFFTGIFGLMALIFAFVFGSLAWRKFFPASFRKSGITIKDKPSFGLVGSEGKGSSLRIKENASITSVSWATADYVMILIATFFFGPVLISGMATHYETTLGKAPTLFFILILLMCGISSAIFVSTVWNLCLHYPKLLIKTSSIEFWRGRQLVQTFWSHQIKQLIIEDHTYVYQGQHGGPHTYANYILTLLMDDGTSVRLCISDRKEQIQQLKESIEGRMML